MITRQRMASRTFTCTDRLHEIHVPTLILQGTHDAHVPSRLAQSMHERICGSQLITIGGGHLFFILRSGQFLAALLVFLASLYPEVQATPVADDSPPARADGRHDP